jgi:hypothetical protein
MCLVTCVLVERIQRQELPSLPCDRLHSFQDELHTVVVQEIRDVEPHEARFHDPEDLFAGVAAGLGEEVTDEDHGGVLVHVQEVLRVGAGARTPATHLERMR